MISIKMETISGWPPISYWPPGKGWAGGKETWIGGGSEG